MNKTSTAFGVGENNNIISSIRYKSKIYRSQIIIKQMNSQLMSKNSINSDVECEQMDNFKKIMKNNKEWAKKCIQQEPDYFLKLVSVQKPKYLWIGCSDSRVPANEIMGLKPGQVFVHRNIANVAPPSDINSLSVIQYAVEHLGVQDIIVCGHYGCGGIKSAFQHDDFGALQSWLCHLRDLRGKFRQSLIGNREQKQKTLVQLNVKQQVINVSRNSAVQKAWLQNKNLHIHGIVYNLNDGILKDLGLTTCRIEHVPEQYRLSKKTKNKELRVLTNGQNRMSKQYNKSRKISTLYALTENIQNKCSQKENC